jgi:hypothetical protein
MMPLRTIAAVFGQDRKTVGISTVSVTVAGPVVGFVLRID